MPDDVTTPEPEPAADRPPPRRPPSQSDIHGISTIASEPRERPATTADRSHHGGSDHGG